MNTTISEIFDNIMSDVKVKPKIIQKVKPKIIPKKQIINQSYNIYYYSIIIFLFLCFCIYIYKLR